mgnify:CR=1 FL=1
MKKKFLTLLLSVAAVVSCAFAFSACTEEHTHSYTQKITTEATCTEKGVMTYTCSCNDTYTEEIPALGHDEKTHQAQEATCTEIGWEEYVTCEREGCDYSTYEEIPATGVHTWDNGKVTTEPTCTETGVKTFTCTVCKTATYTEDVPALTHDKVQHNAQAATCTEKGWEAYETCSRCDYSTFVEIPATGVHTWDNGEVTTEPTCTETGVKTFTCTVCKTATYTEDVPALTHDKIQHNAQEATCTEKGWEAYETCSRCDYSTYEEIPALNHDKVQHNAQEATCTEKGWNAYETCSRCDYSTCVEIPALNHDKVQHNAQEATCTEKGWSAYETCTRCDYSTYEEIPATGVHTWNNGEVTTDPTCTEKGVKTFTCTVCKIATYTEDVPALKHDKVQHNAQAATCTEKGWCAYETCSRCDYSTYEEIPATGVHTWDNGEVTTEPTCTEKGVKTFTCTVCETATKTEPIDKIPHEYSAEWENNDTYHWHECECGDKKDEAKHTAGAPATATTPQTCTICGYVLQEETGILFNTLTMNGTKLYGKVSNDTTEFSFINEVTVKGNATYIVDNDKDCGSPIYSKTVDLEIGDNTFYVLEMIGNDIKLFTVTIRRRPMYEVSFNTNGGVAVEAQVIEEDSLAVQPQTMRAGYTFTGWDYDFATPITQNTEITASWSANKDTKYTVNYYLQNLDDDEYTLHESVELTGTTDTLTAEVDIREYTHFTYNASESTISGNIHGDGSQILSVYYTRNRYTLSINDSAVGAITNSGTYKYGIEDFSATATPYLGYDFLGWYHGETLLSNDLTYTFTAAQDVMAKFEVRPEMSNFNFTSTSTACSITSIKDKTVTEIVVPEYVTKIALGAFQFCTNLTEITLPFVGAEAGVTASDTYQYPLGYIFGTSSYTGGTATTQNYYGSSTSYLSSSIFYIPVSLKKVVITGGNILYGAFYNCSSLTEIVIPDGVTSIGGSAFYGCDSLTSMEIPDGVTYIGGYAFYECSSLTSVVIPDGVTSIGYDAFYNCSSLTSITIPDSVTSIGNSAFYYCSSLTSVVIPDSVTSIGNYAFRYCSSLTKITLPFVGATKGGTSNTHFGYIFGASSYYDNDDYVPTSLKKVTITSATSIDGSAFRNCSSLTSVEIGNGVTSIGSSAFYNCDSLTSVYITDIAAWCNISFGSYDANPLYYAGNLYLNNELVTELIIPDSVTSIGSYAFYNCDSLTSVVIGDGVTTIGERAFYNCDSLTSVVIGDSVTSIGSSAFYECSSLTSVVIGDSVTSIGSSAFKYCSSLTSVVIPDGVTSIGNYAFSGCYKLVEVVNKSTHITVAKGSSSNGNVGRYALAVYNSGDAFTSKLSNDNGYIIYTDGTEKILVGYNGTETDLVLPSYITKINQYAFYKRSSLTSVVIPDSVTSIGSYAFYNCDSLTSVEIPNSVTTIGSYAFYGCDSLTSVVIGDGVTTIGERAFYSCDSLTSITIPDSVTSIGSYAFYYCTSLTSITFKDTSTWYRTTSSSDWNNKTGGTQTSVTNWSTNVTYFKSTYYDNYWYKL